MHRCILHFPPSVDIAFVLSKCIVCLPYPRHLIVIKTLYITCAYIGITTTSVSVPMCHNPNICTCHVPLSLLIAYADFIVHYMFVCLCTYRWPCPCSLQFPLKSACVLPCNIPALVPFYLIHYLFSVPVLKIRLGTLHAPCLS